MQDIQIEVNVIEEEGFIEMASDSTLQLMFKKLPLVKFLVRARVRKWNNVFLKLFQKIQEGRLLSSFS